MLKTQICVTRPQCVKKTEPEQQTRSYQQQELTNIRSANNSGKTQETVNGPTEMNTDAGRKINLKKRTEVTINNTDTHIKLKGEALDYVPE